MTSLKAKVGRGGIDPKILEETQKSLEQTLLRDGQNWIDGQLDELKHALARFADPENEKFESTSELVCVALDLKSTALSIKEDQIAIIAKSMHIFAETSNVQDPKVKSLLTAHLHTAIACRNLNTEDANARKMAKQLVSELLMAVKQVSGR